MRPLALLAVALGCGEGPIPARGSPDKNAPVDVLTLDGDIAWEVVFDEEAQALGQADCTYARSYTGTEDRSAPWLCPDCETVYVAEVAITSGRDCYDRIADDPPDEREWVGYSGDSWFRSGALNYRLTDQGTVAWDGDALSTSYASESYAHPDGGSFQLIVRGELTRGHDRADPFHGWVAPGSYTCGWPKADPSVYRGDFRFEVGRTLPDGVFGDRCGEPVRLHDFSGRYVILGISALDCPPCQDMAAEEADFVSEMGDRGVEVEVITLLAPSLSAPLDETGIALLNAWIQGFELTSPVLEDRGYGYWMSADLLGDDFGYPTVLTVAPDLTVLDVRSGFGSWATWEGLLLAD